MRPEPPPSVIPIAAALIAGAAWGGDRLSVAAATALCIGALAAAAALRRRAGLPLTFVTTCAFFAGSAIQAASWREGGVRLEALFHEATRRDVQLVGKVVAAPERWIDGTRSLLVDTYADPVARVRIEIAETPSDDSERVDALRYGDLVTAWCRLSAPSSGPGRTAEDARRRLAAQRIDATGRAKSSRLVRRIRPGAASWGRAVDCVHVAALLRLDLLFDPRGPTRAVLGAMLLGDRGLLPDELNALLRDAGLVHLLSISGLHTAMTVLVLLAVFRRVGVGPRGLLFGGCAVLVAFAALVGQGASVWRACGGIGAALAARAVGREVDALSALALSSAALVVAVPGLAWSAGFLLSVLATAGLVGFAARGRNVGGMPGIVAGSLRATTGAYAATLPLLATLFGRLAPAALAANLVAAPLCAACLGAGAAAILFARIPGLGRVSALAATFAVKALFVTARAAAAIPGGHLRVASPPGVLIAAYGVALIGVWLVGRGLPEHSGVTLRLIVVLLGISMHLGPPPPGPGPARVDVLDVGQGLSVVLQGPTGAMALYDAGPAGHGRFDAGDRIVIPTLVTRGCRRIEFLALSHDHDDHAGGAAAILRDIDVGELWLAAGTERDPLTRTIAAEAVARGVAVRRLRRGSTLSAAGFAWDVLHPGLADRRRPVNDRCLALRARIDGGPAIVLPGDLEALGERAMLKDGVDPAGEVLVAPHHGADGSSTREFLAAVGARMIAVSAGQGNRFGHPGANALRRYAESGASVARTDLSGTVRFDEARAGWIRSVDDDGRGDERQDEDRDQ